MSDVSVLGKGRWTVRYNFPANFSRQDVQAAKNWVKQAVSCTPDSSSLVKKLTQPRQSPHYRGIVAEIEEEKAGKRQRLWPEVGITSSAHAKDHPETGMSKQQEEVDEHAAEKGGGKQRFLYQDAQGKAINLSLEEAHEAARAGGQGGYQCVDDPAWGKVLKITLQLKRSLPGGATQHPMASSSLPAPSARKRRSSAGSSANTSQGNEDVQQERIARNPAAEQFRKDQLVEWWPTEELPTTFNYDSKLYTYDPAKYGGPVILFKGMKDAMAASNGVSLGFPGVQTALTLMQHHWVKQHIPEEAPPSEETYEEHMAQLLSSMSKSARDATANAKKKVAWDLGWRPAEGKKGIPLQHNSWTIMQAALRKRLEAWQGRDRPKNLAEAKQLIAHPSSLQAYTNIAHMTFRLKTQLPNLIKPWHVKRARSIGNAEVERAQAMPAAPANREEGLLSAASHRESPGFEHVPESGPRDMVPETQHDLAAGSAGAPPTRDHARDSGQDTPLDWRQISLEQEARDKAARQKAEKERKVAMALRRQQQAQAKKGQKEAAQQAKGSKEGNERKKRKGQQSSNGCEGKGGAPRGGSREKNKRDDSGSEDADTSSTDDEEGSMSEHNTSEPSDAGAEQSERGGGEQLQVDGGVGEGEAEGAHGAKRARESARQRERRQKNGTLGQGGGYS